MSPDDATLATFVAGTLGATLDPTSDGVAVCAAAAIERVTGMLRKSEARRG